MQFGKISICTLLVLEKNAIEKEGGMLGWLRILSPSPSVPPRPQKEGKAIGIKKLTRVSSSKKAETGAPGWLSVQIVQLSVV